MRNNTIINGGYFICSIHTNGDFIFSLTSVSGRGINTGGFICKTRSLKSHSSITYCTGILEEYVVTHQSEITINIGNYDCG